MFSWINFLTYAVVTAITPGPNNIMSMSNASRIGFKKTLPFNFGIMTGFLLVTTICTLLSNFLSSLLPAIEFPMLIIGAAYMLYLAWKTFKSGDTIEENTSKSGFISGMLLQFVNPKIYIYCIVSMQAYILPFFKENIPVLLFFAFVLSSIGFICTLCWSGFGSLFKMIFSKYSKITNTIMALLLVYCAVSLFL